MTTTAPSPREVEALAVVEETDRLLHEVKRLLDALPVVDVQQDAVEATQRAVQRPARTG